MKEDNIEYKGNDIPGKNKRVYGLGECINWCKGLPECGYWTYTKSVRWCWLKTQDSGRANNSNTISGNRNCTSRAGN